MKKRQKYFSKYDNETSKFIKNLDKSIKLIDLANKLNVTYAILHYAFKVNRISYTLFTKIITTISLDYEKLTELKKLVAN